MGTITRLIHIITEQNGYILTTGDLTAVSKACFAIAGILLVVDIAIRVQMYRKAKTI